VPGGEQQVDDGEHRVDALRQRCRRRHLVRDAGRRDLLLGAGDAGRHGGLADEERTCHLRRRESAQQPQRQGHLRALRQGGMAAREDQPQPVVRDLRLRIRVGLVE
jgi:hypothetical protein